MTTKKTLDSEDCYAEDAWEATHFVDCFQGFPRSWRTLLWKGALRRDARDVGDTSLLVHRHYHCRRHHHPNERVPRVSGRENAWLDARRVIVEVLVDWRGKRWTGWLLLVVYETRRK